MDGSPIRVLEASPTGEVSALAVDPAGEAIVTGGGDKLVKLWGYDEGHCYYAGGRPSPGGHCVCMESGAAWGCRVQGGCVWPSSCCTAGIWWMRVVATGRPQHKGRP